MKKSVQLDVSRRLFLKAGLGVAVLGAFGGASLRRSLPRSPRLAAQRANSTAPVQPGAPTRRQDFDARLG